MAEATKPDGDEDLSDHHPTALRVYVEIKHLVLAGLCPSDSPTRALARRSPTALSIAGSLATLVRPLWYASSASESDSDAPPLDILRPANFVADANCGARRIAGPRIVSRCSSQSFKLQETIRI